MKLVYCLKCDSIIRLHRNHRQCECWHAGGKYIDELNAVYYWKQTFLMGLDNNSFAIRLNKDINKNFAYNISKKLDIDSSHISCFAIGKSDFCASWECKKTITELSKKDYKKKFLQ